MAADSKQNIKTLRVDNWAVFFLQRLQLMFAKGDGCDLTLKFHTGQELKVHRLVLITSTMFFETMHKDGDVISMPVDLPYSVVQPIINFLYSGKLEFKSELHDQLLSISRSLNIAILSKLLITQKNDNGLGVLPAMKVDGGKKHPQRTFLATRISPTLGGGLGGRKLPIWRQRTFPLFRPDRNRIIKDEEPRPMRFEWPEGKEPTDSLLLTSPSFTPLSYKSEPVFTPVNPPILGGLHEDSPPPLPHSSLKRRAAPASVIPDKVFKEEKRDRHPEAEIKKEDLGNFSDDDDDGHFETIHSYDDSDDDPDQETRLKPQEEVSSPAVNPQPPFSLTATQCYSSPARLRQAATQPSTPPQQRVVAGTERFAPLAESTPAIVPPPPVASTPPTPKPILKPNTELPVGQNPAKKVRFSLDKDEDKLISKQLEAQSEVLKQTTKDLQSPSLTALTDVSYEAQATDDPPLPSTDIQSHLPPPSVHSVVQSTTKDIPPSDVPSQGTKTAVSTSSVVTHQSTLISAPNKGTMQTYSKNPHKSEKKTISPAESANHAKIIAEVLKKYPDLVKNNKNIRLKISAPGNTSITNTLTLDTKNAAGKAYVVVKSSVKTEKDSSSLPFKTGTPSSSRKSLQSHVLPLAPPQPQTANSTGNGTGPWSCSPCGAEGAPLKFNSYYEYRRHFVEVHNEKFDSRTCEHCGYKTSKRNLYLYHLFTKHNVSPPKSIIFPKCDLCGYIALSDGLLQKHAATHKPKDWPCSRCQVVFKSHTSLQMHISTCNGMSSDNKISFSCSYCSANFRTNVQLNSHVKICSANTSVIQKSNVVPGNSVNDIYEESSQSEQAVEMIEVPIMDAGKGEHTYVQLPSGLILTGNPNVALLPAGDGDELTSAENNLGASIGITMALPQDQHVILLDANSEFFIQGNVVSRLNPNSEEYIVPEVLEDGMQQIYSTQGLPYSVATSTGNMIACPVVPMASSEQLDKHEDSGNTVVRVHDHVDPNELDNVHVQHHVNASDIEYTDDIEQQTHSNNDQVDGYVEEQPAEPQRHEITINKELMEVVAMEVQRAPLDHSSVVMSLPQPLQPQHSVLATNQYRRADPQPLPENTRLPDLSAVNSQNQKSSPEQESENTDIISADGPGRISDDKSLDDGEVIEIDDSGDGEKMTQQAAKADSLVKDWGFDNEEESDAAVVIDDDSDSDEDGARMGPSRVTVEL